jgi:hypothetical protein
MKPRHAAALALIGWYLISPHARRSLVSDDPDITAPFWKWRILETFKTAAACEHQKTADIKMVERMVEDPVFQATVKKNHPNWNPDLALKTTRDEMCIATDDPRLAK